MESILDPVDPNIPGTILLIVRSPFFMVKIVLSLPSQLRFQVKSEDPGNSKIPSKVSWKEKLFLKE